MQCWTHIRPCANKTCHCSHKPRIRGQLLDLIVEPLTGLGSSGLASSAAKTVRGCTIRVEAWALRTAGQCPRASVGLARGLQPEVRIDNIRVRCLGGREQADACSADVAPILALRTLVCDAVAACVDDDVRHEATDALGHGLPQVQSVVVLVVRWVPLARQTAGISAARVTRVRIVQAEVVGRAHLPQGLVTCDIRREAAQVRRHGKVPDGGHIVLHIVLPAQPASMPSIEVHGHTRRCGTDALHSILDAALVCSHRCRIATSRVPMIGGQVRQGIRLDDQDDRHTALVLLQEAHDLVDVLGLVLRKASRAVTCFRVVATAIRIVGAADLAVGSLRMAIAVRQVVDDEGHQLRRALGGGIRQDALHRVAAAAQDLALGVQPVGRGHILHALERSLDLALRRGNGLPQRRCI
mmetsp:Transcript_15305/g.38487  ORF Transcript_15305/g.38487 Transcript_15305/m.38487 type:complete len:411 (+) Transcript_15305:136-1368(+)